MKTQDKLFLTIGAAAVVGTSGFIGYSLFATKDTELQTPTNTQQSSVPTSSQPEAATQPESPNSNATNTTTSATYNDGTYSASTSYRVPHGETNSLKATVVVSGGKITSVQTTNNYNDRESAMYIDSFKSSVSSTVVGRPLGNVGASRIGGASLTSEAFTSVLDTIRSDAKA